MGIIKFYKVNEEYGYFSNFAPYYIFIDGVVWKSVEHYFQANKFENAQLQLKINSYESPMKAAEEGRDRKNIIREDWDFVKEDYMYKGLFAKFSQYPHLRINLLQTANLQIIEDTSYDNYWGNGRDGRGLNRLGELIMKVRNDLQNISTDQEIILPPWIAFPNINQIDLFWRMGLGEEYLTKWAKFYLNNDVRQYKMDFVPDKDWIDFYE